MKINWGHNGQLYISRNGGIRIKINLRDIRSNIWSVKSQVRSEHLNQPFADKSTTRMFQHSEHRLSQMFNQTFVWGDNSFGDEREKRSFLGALGSLLGVVSLGFGISNSLQIGKLENEFAEHVHEENHVFAAFNRSLHRLQDHINQEDRFIEAELERVGVENLVNGLELRFGRISHVIEEAKKGRLAPDLIHESELRELLRKMSRKARDRGLLFLPQIVDIFSCPVLLEKEKNDDDTLHLTILVPLMTDKFKIYALQNLPDFTVVEDFVYLNFTNTRDFLAIQTRGNSFIPLTRLELLEYCTMHVRDNYICRLDLNVYHDPKTNCEASLYFDKRSDLCSTYLQKSRFYVVNDIRNKENFHVFTAERIRYETSCGTLRKEYLSSKHLSDTLKKAITKLK